MSEPRAPGQRALDEEEVALGVGADDPQLLDRGPLVAHVAGHLQALVDAARRRARADRAGLAVMVGAVGLGPAVEVVALDLAGEALALRDAGDVDEVALVEEVADRERLADLVAVDAVEAELADRRQELGAFGRSLSWPASGLRQLLRLVASRAGRPCSRRDRAVRRRVTVFGSMARTLTATIVPSPWNTCVMPTLRPISPILMSPDTS